MCAQLHVHSLGAAACAKREPWLVVMGGRPQRARTCGTGALRGGALCGEYSVGSTVWGALCGRAQGPGGRQPLVLSPCLLSEGSVASEGQGTACP